MTKVKQYRNVEAQESFSYYSVPTDLNDDWRIRFGSRRPSEIGIVWFSELEALLTDLPRTLSTGGGDARTTRARPKSEA